MNDQSGGIAISMDEYLVSSGGYLASSGMSAASMGLLARACSRGGVILNDGRRVAAATGKSPQPRSDPTSAIMTPTPYSPKKSAIWMNFGTS